MKSKSLKNSLKYYDTELNEPMSKAKEEMNELLDQDLENIKNRYIALVNKRKKNSQTKSA